MSQVVIPKTILREYRILTPDIEYNNDDWSSLLQRRLERVSLDPNYNLFDFTNNGFKDLVGVAFIWKTDPDRKTRNIIEAGRQIYLILEEDVFS